jgi:murein DD-endopeptidase MepM/ murein hydrolase activator NlpD
MISTHHHNLEERITQLETELRLYKDLKLSSIERKLNQLLDELENQAPSQTKGQRLKERLGIIASTIALTALAQGQVEIPLEFQQPTKQEQASSFSPGLAPALEKIQSSSAPSLSKPTPKPETKPVELSLEKLMKAIATQESGNNPKLINNDSGASGKWQIMPANIGPWSLAAVGRRVSHAEFMASPELQRQISKHRLALYLKEQSTPGRTEEEVIRRVASLWYSGRSHLWNNTRPQFSNGRQYPSIDSYTRSVWRHYIDAKVPSYPEAKAAIASWPQQFQKDAEKDDVVSGFIVTSPKGNRIHPITGKVSPHNGVDIATPVGTPLYAITDGRVEYGYNSIAGLYASFTSDSFPGLAFKLVHLSKGLAQPGTKQEVKQGEVIGWSGGAEGDPNAGRSTGPHLHLGIKGDSGNWLRVRLGWIHWFVTGQKP